MPDATLPTDALTARRPTPGARRATFAAGCFGGVEAAFREIDGVLRTTVGYTGGRTSDPTYEQVCGHRTGYAEAIEVWFDPDRVTYGDLLDTFWDIHNPTTPNCRGWGVGDQYRSAIFFDDSIQEGLAIATRNDAQQSLVKPIVTEITPATKFYAAEEYHQRSFAKRGSDSCAISLRSEVEAGRAPRRENDPTGSFPARDDARYRLRRQRDAARPARARRSVRGAAWFPGAA